ncbi:lipase family protein [Amycolatopsis aidingensis]|uniref:lipase family protein n=1 Tax=Amycolatopsis aidingensis TaxID=2842453 RepID=UPI001C0D56B6|nr:lipase family protein [Amycolatopsis aidingensis]
MTAVVAAMTMVGLTAGVGASAAASPADIVPPSQDPFYAVPSNVADYQPGAVIRSRQITPKWALGELPAVQAWQVAYRTNDGEDAPTATVATVLIPDKPWTGPGTRPLMSYQSAEDSVGIDCAPSYSWRNGIFAGLGEPLADPFAVAPALLAGWGVVVPDYEGPKGMFGVGRMAGHGVLDGIRAALNFAPDGLDRNTKVAAFGYSGGGLATGWAAELQGSYAPELNYVGTAGGGTPAKLLDVVKWLTGPGRYAAGLAAGGMIGIMKQYPHLQKFLNDKGREFYKRYENACAPQLVAELPFRDINQYTNSPDLFAEPEVVAAAERQSMGSQAPKAPVANYHGMLDEVVPFPQNKQAVEEWCSRGASVDVTWVPLAEHVLGVAPWYLAGYAFLNDRFAGKPAVNDCGTVTSS